MHHLSPSWSWCPRPRTAPDRAGGHAAAPLQAFLGQGVAEARGGQDGAQPRSDRRVEMEVWMGLEIDGFYQGKAHL